MPWLGGHQEHGLPGVIRLHFARAQNLAQEPPPGAAPRAFPRLALTSHVRIEHTRCVTWLPDARRPRLRRGHSAPVVGAITGRSGCAYRRHSPRTPHSVLGTRLPQTRGGLPRFRVSPWPWPRLPSAYGPESSRVESAPPPAKT